MIISPKKASNFSTLHSQALVISKELKRQEFLMIEILQEIDEQKVFRFLGFKSLFQYATSGLGLGEQRAYTFILVSRKSAKISQFQEALRSGKLTLSKAKKITSVITPENAEHWLSKANVMSQRQLERAVAKVNPKLSVEEGFRFISENILEFKAALGVETEQKMRRVQDILCQSQGKAISWEETLGAMAQLFLERRDPVSKAERILKRQAKNSNGKQEPQQQQQDLRKQEDKQQEQELQQDHRQ